MIKEKDTKLSEDGSVKRKDCGRLTAGKVSKIAYDISNKGKCWWVENYIKNSFSRNVNMKRRR